MTSRVEDMIHTGFNFAFRRVSGDAEEEHVDEDEHSEFGVHIEYKFLYNAIIFLTAIYVCGAFCQKVLKMPSLVGEIFAGIVLGPPLLDFVPNAVAFVMLGEIGLILLVIEAGIDIDLTTLKLIGARGVIIAIIGSILPIVFGIAIAYAIGTDTTGAIAAGAAFGPTSLGIAMNILRQGKIVNTPVGQLIVSAAVIDDMIALVILSQLAALTGEVSVSGVVIPIVSAICFLVGGGYLAVNVLPFIINDYVLVCFPENIHPQISLTIMFVLMIGLMPACYYSRASFLMGVFISGLTFCRDHDVHRLFGTQFKRLLQWLMRIFFAASIGFQVPIKDFGKGTVIWQGLVFTLALAGKLAVGFLVPNFNQTPSFTGNHIRDVLVTGFSMAAEGEFAFVIAVYAVDNGLIDKDLYASIVLAVLISTIIPPFLLRFTIAKYNKKAELLLQETVKLEIKKKLDIDSGKNVDDDLRKGIKDETTIFLCIQMQCESKWGLLNKIMTEMKKIHLDVIDHRSWHPRGVDSTLVNEIYAKGHFDESKETVEVYSDGVHDSLMHLLNQPEASVKVTRWHPGVVTEIVEELDTGTGESEVQHKISVSDKILKEAQTMLESKQKLQLTATQDRTVEEILNTGIPVESIPPPEVKNADPVAATKVAKRRNRRVRTMSTPVIGGDLFAGKTANSASITTTTKGTDGTTKKSTISQIPSFTRGAAPGVSGGIHSMNATLTVGEEEFNIQISAAVLAKVRKERNITLNAKDVKAREKTGDLKMEFQLDGFVRRPVFSGLQSVSEEEED